MLNSVLGYLRGIYKVLEILETTGWYRVYIEVQKGRGDTGTGRFRQLLEDTGGYSRVQ